MLGRTVFLLGRMVLPCGVAASDPQGPASLYGPQDLSMLSDGKDSSAVCASPARSHQGLSNPGRKVAALA